MSQIVRTAVSEIAHREVIDLTLDDSDNDIPRQEAVNKPVSQPPVLASTVTPVTPMSKPIKTLDLNAVRKLRKPHRTPQQLRLSKPTLTPFPRNLHRVSSAPTLPEAITMALSSTQVNAMASSSTNDRRSLSKTPYSSMEKCAGHQHSIFASHAW
ncbi:hypothetical protein BC628DRAFT_536839 [Trametes gibbosa]|nr:hypothetical protein BC628DRAFT_536839 [Trametes gibbosa]